MDVLFRSQQLSRLFSYGEKVMLQESRLAIHPFQFHPTMGVGEIDRMQGAFDGSDFCPVADNRIPENKSFSYTLFAPLHQNSFDEAIVLLHGLNERSWVKYLTWAEYLAARTGKPVILFPIAFHMNRTPELWSNPRQILPWVNKRKQGKGNFANTTFVNLALSSRLSRIPLRFYTSGRESVYNLCQLVREIKAGDHPLFRENSSVNLFAYSIGALLSQVLLLADPGGLFTNSKLFMFCGGSIFNEMNGNARDIMDGEAYERVQRYFTTDFLEARHLPDSFQCDAIEQAFKAMIRPDLLTEYRESFFLRACHRIRAISLKRDIVMPTQGIIKAIGKASGKILQELDFPFEYSHQKPFPLHPNANKEEVNSAFTTVFSQAAGFL